jgi:hypothetical protein
MESWSQSDCNSFIPAARKEAKFILTESIKTSGVETEPGKKDHDKLRAFLITAKGIRQSSVPVHRK